MPDLFPTTDEAEKDQNFADAAAGGQGIVNHLGPDSFATDGLRPLFEYRPLGLELTGEGRRARDPRQPGQHADAPHHSHTLEFQFVYVLKGWAIFDYEGYGQHKLVAGRPSTSRRKSAQLPGDRPLRRFRGLEIAVPADSETKEVK